MRRKTCGLVFPTSGCNPKQNFLDDLKACAERAKLKKEDFWLHKFRATFATNDTHAAASQLLDDAVMRDGLANHGWRSGCNVRSAATAKSTKGDASPSARRICPVAFKRG
jgi:hypothetical protein